MELLLDSADINEIESVGQYGLIQGLTTTPTFMHRHGITNIDDTILKLAKMVPVLHIEALGETAEDICAEAERFLALGLDSKKTVFKIPVSLEGVKACKILRDKEVMVNLHLIYTIQQAYMAAVAGANYICILVGRMQDEGYDAITLIKEVAQMLKTHNYKSKIMFSSVRNREHIRNAITYGAHTITAPWSVLRTLTDNNFTKIGTQQFERHTRLMTTRVQDVISNRNPVVPVEGRIIDAIVEMSKGGFGAVSIVDKEGRLVGVFTDGDLRRHLGTNGEAILDKKLADFEYKQPWMISQNVLLNVAHEMFKTSQVDTLVVSGGNGIPVGMLDIQDLL